MHAGWRGRSGESYEDTAHRELLEETGLDRDCGPQVARRQVEFRTIEGVEVEADERYFRVDVDAHDATAAGHTVLEQRVMQSWRWFTRQELAAHDEPYFPTDLIELLDATEPPHV